MKILKGTEIIKTTYDWNEFEKLCKDLIKEGKDKDYRATIAGKKFELTTIFNEPYK